MLFIARLTENQYIEIPLETFKRLSYGGMDLGNMFSLGIGDEVLLFELGEGNPKVSLVAILFRASTGWTFVNHIGGPVDCRTYTAGEMRIKFFCRRWI